MSIDWGLVVNALSAGGSISAAAAALWIATRDRRDRKLERESEAQAQANLVLISIKSSRGSFLVDVTNHGIDPLLGVEFVSARYSPNPAAIAQFGDRAPRLVPVLDPTETCTSWFEFFDGGEAVLKGKTGPLGEWVSDDPTASHPSNVSAVVVRWLDAHGRRWEVAHPGRARRVGGSASAEHLHADP